MIFELAYHGYDEYNPYLFEHNSKTEKQFSRDVKLMLNKYCIDYLKQEGFFASANDLIKFISQKMEELGYKLITPYQFSILGCTICQAPQYEGLYKILDKKLFKKILLHNKRVKNISRKGE